MGIGEKIAAARKAKGWTQEDLAWKTEVSIAAVSAWETGKSAPDKEHMVALSGLLGLSLEELLADVPATGLVPGNPYFDPEHMYTYVKAKAQAAGLTQTLSALPVMREKHAGQTRDGSDDPYSVHPLTMACHALAMDIASDEVLATALLHDVIEETKTSLDELPVSEEVREAVRLLSKNTYPGDHEKNNPLYYEKIRENPLAALIKCMDRCNNLSSMAMGFSKKRMVEYVKETEQYILPLLDVVKAVSKWNNAAWLLRYQMVTMVETFKRLL